MASPLGKRVLNYFDLRAPDRGARPAAGWAPEPATATAEVTPPVPQTDVPPPTGTTTQPVPPLKIGGLLLSQQGLWPLVLYAAGMLGVIAKQWYDGYQQGIAMNVHPTTFILAVVVSAVTFPATYHTLQAESKPAMQLFLALQNGFFWQSVLGGLMR